MGEGAGELIYSNEATSGSCRSILAIFLIIRRLALVIVQSRCENEGAGHCRHYCIGFPSSRPATPPGKGLARPETGAGIFER